jgi:hypothetical protein
MLQKLCKNIELCQKNYIAIGTDEAVSPRRKFKLCAEHRTKNALGFSDKILDWMTWCRLTMFAPLSYAWPQQSLRFISKAANCAFSSSVKLYPVLLIMCMKAMKYSLICTSALSEISMIRMINVNCSL